MLFNCRSNLQDKIDYLTKLNILIEQPDFSCGKTSQVLNVASQKFIEHMLEFLLLE